jgi:hypothetical protein
MGSRLHNNRKSGGADPKFDKAEIEFEDGIADYELDSSPIINSETLSTPSYELREGIDYTLNENVISLILESDFCSLLRTGAVIKAKWAYK